MVDTDDLRITQFAYGISEDGGRERYMRDFSRMLDGAPIYVINDEREKT